MAASSKTCLIHRSAGAFLFSICVVTLTLPGRIDAQSRSDETVVDSFIASQAKKERAEEYREARKVVHSDLNGDGKEDVVTLYTLESFGGANLYRQYLPVFINRGGVLEYVAHAVVGGKNERTLELKSVSGNEIYFDTLEYLPRDASCCPSGKGHTRYIFSRGKLKELTRP